MKNRLYIIIAFITALTPTKNVHVQDIAKLIRENAEAIQPQLAKWRRALHRHPELVNQGFKTAAFIAGRLKGLGLEIQTGVAKTGVVALL